MIGQILKKQYEDWVTTSEVKDPAEFIALAADKHQTTTEQIGEILKLHTWFQVE
jgi:hypothetical protein